MTRTTAIAGLLSLCFATGTPAQDSQRTAALEKEVQELKLRLSKLEAFVNSPAKTEPTVVPGDGWKSIANWRRLERGMDTKQVRAILGEPKRIDGGYVSSWSYDNGGGLLFTDGKVSNWTEPRP